MASVIPDVIVICSEETGLGSLRCLHAAGLKVFAILKSVRDISIYSRLPVKKHILTGIEYSDYLQVLELYKGNNIYLLGTNDSHIKLLSENALELEEMGYILALPPVDLVDSLNDKYTEVRLVESLGIMTPFTLLFSNLKSGDLSGLNYPVIVKPRMQWHKFLGAKNIVVNDELEMNDLLASHHDHSEDLIVQKMLDFDAESICAFCLFNNSSDLVSCFMFKRIRMSPAYTGVTSYALSYISDEVRNKVTYLGKQLGYRGIADIEFLYDKDSEDYVYIETNPRVTMTLAFAEKNGVNILYDAYRLFVKNEEIVPKKQKCSHAFLNIFDDAYSQYKNNKSLLEIIKGYININSFACTGLYWRYNDPYPAIRKTFSYFHEILLSILKKLR